MSVDVNRSSRRDSVTADTAGDTRPLPGPSSPAWDDPATVAAIAGVDLSDIERAAEVTWWQRAAQRPVWTSDGWPR